jgi:hypothetical protein
MKLPGLWVKYSSKNTIPFSTGIIVELGFPPSAHRKSKKIRIRLLFRTRNLRTFKEVILII